MHFYHLHALDWVDVVSALKADPKKTSELAAIASPPWPNSSPGYFRDVQNRLKKFVESGQLGIFANGYWGSPAYKLPPEANLMATTHYLEALDFQKEIVKIKTIFGGKNPHPNWLVGGVPCSLNVDERRRGRRHQHGRSSTWSATSSTARSTSSTRSTFPTCSPIASFYKDWAKWGGGLSSSQNVMSYGEFPDIANDYSNKSLLMPSGVILGGNLKERARRRPEGTRPDPGMGHPLAGTSTRDESKGLHPFDGVTEPNFVLGTGDQGHAHGRSRTSTSRAKYSWVKSPRWKGNAVEVGPARALRRRLRARPRGHQGAGRQRPEDARRSDHGAVLDARPHGGARPRVPWAAHKMKYFYDRADRQHQVGRPRDGQHREVGAVDLARREQGRRRRAKRRAERWRHWVKIKDARIDSYQCVVPTTWNASPRDAKGQIGAYEAALLNTPMVEPGAAARDPAHDPQLRSLPRLRVARDVDRGRGARLGAGALRAAPRSRSMEVERWTGRVTGGPLTDVYVYEAPVRIWHWVTMVCMIVLGVTGYLIGAPPPRDRRRAA